MTKIIREKGQFAQNEYISSMCYYHTIFGSIIALGAIMNELGAIALLDFFVLLFLPSIARKGNILC